MLNSSQVPSLPCLLSQYKVLSRGCGILLSGHLMDPKVAHWLLDPGSKERNLQGLVTNYIPTEGHILEGMEDLKPRPLV